MTSAQLFIVNVEVAVLPDGRYLCTVRGGGESFGAEWLGFPGGKVDWEGPVAEVIESTAHREVQEEVGLELVDPIVYVESHTFGELETPVVDVVVLARSSAGEPSVEDPDEVAEVCWMSAADLRSDHRVQPWTLASLEDVERMRLVLGW